MDTNDEHYAQFVAFSTAGALPSELFQRAWIPHGKEFYERGIRNIILSEKLSIAGEFNPYKFVAKNWWDSKKAVQVTMQDGVPVPATRGHITVSNAGVFKVISWTDTISKHKAMCPKINNQFKILFMLPTKVEIEDSTIKELNEFVSTLSGFDCLCTYKLDGVSGDISNVWLFNWIIEAYFNLEIVDPAELMDEIRSGGKFTKEWKICTFEDEVQITPRCV